VLYIIFREGYPYFWCIEHQNTVEECGKYVNIYVNLVGIFGEVSTRMRGAEYLKIYTP